MASERSNLRTIRITPARTLVSSRSARLRTEGDVTSRQTGVAFPAMIATKSSNSDEDLEFVFPFPPQQISYRELSPEIAQIERPGKTPLVAFNKFRARQIDLRFLVAVPFDGLSIDIEADLQLLERIANTGRPVWFYNLDKFLSSNPQARTSDDRTFFWTITDLSFESVRRNTAQRIVQAEVSMSIVENNNPNIVVVELPRIQYGDTVQTVNPPRSNGSSLEESFLSWTEVDAINGRG